PGPGIPFDEFINQIVASVDFVLIVIGPRFLGDSKSNRIFSEHDPVRLMIEETIRQKKYLLPILTNGANPPSPGQLPDTLQNLPYQNYSILNSGVEFEGDLQR